MKALALAMSLCLSAQVWAADDAPVVPTVPAPFLITDEHEQVQIARYIVKLETENVELKAEVMKAPNTLVVIGLVALGVIVGGAAGFGIAKATTPKP